MLKNAWDILDFSRWFSIWRIPVVVNGNIYNVNYDSLCNINPDICVEYYPLHEYRIYVDNAEKLRMYRCTAMISLFMILGAVFIKRFYSKYTVNRKIMMMYTFSATSALILYSIITCHCVREQLSLRS